MVNLSISLVQIALWDMIMKCFNFLFLFFLLEILLAKVLAISLSSCALSSPSEAAVLFLAEVQGVIPFPRPCLD